MSLGVQILIYIGSFILIWYGSGLIVSSVDTVSRKLRLSAFAVSFIVLGILTSIPEFAIGLTAIAEEDPEIFIGNLLGGIPVIFLGIIPLLAVVGNGINLKHHFDRRSLLITLSVIAAPSILILDGAISPDEAIILMLLYGMLLMVIGRRHGIFSRNQKNGLNFKAFSYHDMLKVVVGVGIVFVSSQSIVHRTVLFSEYFSIAPFVVSLLVLSLGTNLPELAIATRSIISGRKDVAFGNYMGSAAANTVLFGIFTLLSYDLPTPVQSVQVSVIFIIGGLTLFYLFSRSSNDLSRKEGLVLGGMYAFFISMQLLTQSL